METTVLLKAGAILLGKAKLAEDILSDDVVARQWIHPALKEPIVRLPTQNMLRGVDLEMDLLGFSEARELGLSESNVVQSLVSPAGHWFMIPTMLATLWTSSRNSKKRPGESSPNPVAQKIRSTKLRRTFLLPFQISYPLFTKKRLVPFWPLRTIPMRPSILRKREMPNGFMHSKLMRNYANKVSWILRSRVLFPSSRLPILAWR